jgi:glycosyltransferase involved in cell wall biosynthesis
MNVNQDLTVITVTFNNAAGLRKTLTSLVVATTRPLVVIIIDNLSSDGTVEIVAEFRQNLNILYIRERDAGIYDGMNKGREVTQTRLIHYLNSGDTIFGDPYKAISESCLLPVLLQVNDQKKEWFDFVKFAGYGYCHQGIIFNRSHAMYDIKIKLAADIDVIFREYSKGLGGLKLNESGYVVFQLGGASSQSGFVEMVQIVKSAYLNLHLTNATKFTVLLFFKSLLTSGIKRKIATLYSRTFKPRR